jgi:hypothetical protein
LRATFSSVRGTKWKQVIIKESEMNAVTEMPSPLVFTDNAAKKVKELRIKISKLKSEEKKIKKIFRKASDKN